MEQVTSPDGTVIGWVRSGTGAPLLLVHGTTADHTRWAPILARLEASFTVLAMDRRGRGLSSDGPVYDIRREAEDVAAVIDAVGEEVCVLGHSYGAVCSLEAALLTEGVSRMVLYEPPIPTGLPMHPPGVPDRMQELIDSGELEAALEMFFGEVVGMPDEELARYRAQPVWEVRVGLAPTIPRELTIDRTYEFEAGRFADVGVPTRLLLGGNSPPMFQRAVAAVAGALPNASVEVLPDQQHVAMDMDPDLFLRAVVGFLRE